MIAMGDNELTPEEMQSFKQELADIKADMMRKELEEIKKERMRKELDEIRKERESSAPKRAPVRVVQPQLSLANVLLAALSLILAGYLIGTLYAINVTATVDGLLTGYGLPALGSIVVIALAVLLALFGAGMITIAKK